ncbi:MAG: hypothetical protein Q4G08_11735 [Capnocytophaga sp.]|nr:hypothetical protein [Capnocytophaga sp.]
MLNQEQYERFISHLPKDISTSFKEAVKEEANFIVLKKGEILFDEYTKNNKGYLILKGSCVRCIITPNGDEKVVFFHTEDFIPIIGNAYVRSENSIVSYSLKANENTEVVEIDISIQEFIKTDTAYIQFATQNALRFFAIQNQIQNHLIGLSSEDFFQWLIKEYSFIFQRFQSKDIASFMGVTPTWLSLLKRKVTQK